MLGKEIMKIKILDNFEKALIALDDCGYENDFSFNIDDHGVITITIEEKFLNIDEMRSTIFTILDNCGYENDFSFEIVKGA